MTVLATGIDRAWLADVLKADGYETELPPGQETVRARHHQRPNLIAKVIEPQGIIEFVHFWHTEHGFGKDKQFREAVNQANLKSLFETFAIDPDGDLMVSSYIVLPERGLTEDDIRGFLSRVSEHFLIVLMGSGLREFVQ
jgi:hypothetical protein